MIMVKTCAFCEKTDGMCYTSNPPKRKCTITGKFHEYDHICDVPITNADRIRAMSDDELARFLADKLENEYILSCKRLGYEEHMLTATEIEAIRHTCYCTWMQWLRHRAED
jgi:hypothetical protein